MSGEGELEKRLAEIEARETEVARREKAVAAKGLRYNLYDRVSLSPRAIDAVIVACVAAIAALLAIGMLFGRT